MNWIKMRSEIGEVLVKRDQILGPYYKATYAIADKKSKIGSLEATIRIHRERKEYAGLNIWLINAYSPAVSYDEKERWLRELKTQQEQKLKSQVQTLPSPVQPIPVETPVQLPALPPGPTEPAVPPVSTASSSSAPAPLPTVALSSTPAPIPSRFTPEPTNTSLSRSEWDTRLLSVSQRYEELWNALSQSTREAIQDDENEFQNHIKNYPPDQKIPTLMSRMRYFRTLIH